MLGCWGSPDFSWIQGRGTLRAPLPLQAALGSFLRVAGLQASHTNSVRRPDCPSCESRMADAEHDGMCCGFYARGVQPRAGFREASSEFSAILAAIQSRETVVARREQDACAEARAAEAIRA